MKIFCKFPTINISNLNFWLVICIAKDFIWTTLKAKLFFYFLFFFAPSDSRFSNSCISAKYCHILTNNTSIQPRAVTILLFLYRGYCGHKNSQYRYIAISIETLGEKKDMSNYFLLCLLSFSFSPNEYNDTDKHRAQDSGFLNNMMNKY